MTTETHTQLASFIWSICNLLRRPYKRNEYRKIILPLTVLRRFDCILAPTKAPVLAEYKALEGKPEKIIQHRLCRITGLQFYNLSKFAFLRPNDQQGFKGLMDDPNQLGPNLNAYLQGFSPNVRAIMERFAFGVQVAKKKGVRLAAPELKAILAALGERDENAVICRDAKGNPEPDADLRDTETVPLKEDVQAYFRREVTA